MYSSLTLQPAPLRYVVNHNDYMLLLTDDEISVHTLDADGYTFTPTTGTDAGNRQYLPSPATCTQRQLPTPLFLRPRRPAGVIRRRPELDTKQRVGFRRLLTSTVITINQHNPKSGARYEQYEGCRFANACRYRASPTFPSPELTGHTRHSPG